MQHARAQIAAPAQTPLDIEQAAKIATDHRIGTGRPWRSANSASTSANVLCTAGAMMCDGVSPASCTIYSPRSVSIGSMPAALSSSLSCASSESIDFDLTALLPPWRLAMSIT